MNYYISRDGQQFGPYTLEEVQRYVKDGNILLTDLAHGEGMSSWVPVQQILNPTPQAAPQAAPVYGAPPSYGAAPGAPPNYGQAPNYPASPGYGGAQGYAAAPAYPQAGGFVGQPVPAAAGVLPPDMAWPLVLLLGMFTGGLFMIIWAFVQAGFVKKIRPNSNGLLYYSLSIAAVVLGILLLAAGGSNNETGIAVLGGLVFMAYPVLIIMGHFNIRNSLEEYYTTVEPYNLRLSGAMTFFFNTLYFQYHFNWIRQYKVTGVMNR